jgi:cell division protein FtsL
MSTAAGPAYRQRPVHDPRPDPRHRLRAVTRPRRVSRLPFILFAGLAIVAGALGLLSLNVNVNQQAFTIAKLERANREAENRYTTLQADVDRLKAPDRIAREAAKRGLVPAGRPRVSVWPGSKPSRTTSAPGAATSPAAPGAGSNSDPSAWSTDPNPLKQYLAEP